MGEVKLNELSFELFLTIYIGSNQVDVAGNLPDLAGDTKIRLCQDLVLLNLATSL